MYAISSVYYSAYKPVLYDLDHFELQMFSVLCKKVGIIPVKHHNLVDDKTRIIKGADIFEENSSGKNIKILTLLIAKMAYLKSLNLYKS